MATSEITKILLKKSNVVTNQQPKLPLTTDLDYGEIAVNYAQGYETISLKNSANQIATIQNEIYVGALNNAKNTTAKFCIDTTQTPNVFYVRTNTNTWNVVGDTSLKVTTQTSVTSIPTTSDIVVVTSSANGSLTLSGSVIPQGKELHIIVKNSSTTKEITITIPTNTFKNANVDTVTIPSSSFGEINILSTGTTSDGYYLRAVD